VFAYLGLIPWTFFSASVAQGGISLLSNRSLLNKIYCPREVFPTASVVVAALDSCVALSGLVVLLAVFRVVPSPTVFWVPILLAVQVAFSLGVAYLLAATILYFRDLRHVLPLILQLGLFATPVAYGMDVVPDSLRFLYAAANPLAPVIDGYRRTILLGRAPDFALLAVGAVSSLVALIGGYLVFKKLESGFADIA
jgi:ABC-2 type transport system permease protein/lipopolysaccharide transport system permease protein